jgi:hypothetical protein
MTRCIRSPVTQPASEPAVSGPPARSAEWCAAGQVVHQRDTVRAGTITLRCTTRAPDTSCQPAHQPVAAPPGTHRTPTHQSQEPVNPRDRGLPAQILSGQPLNSGVNPANIRVRVGDGAVSHRPAGTERANPQTAVRTTVSSRRAGSGARARAARSGPTPTTIRSRSSPTSGGPAADRGGGAGFPGLRWRGDLLGSADGLGQAPYLRESRRIKAEYRISPSRCTARSSTAAVSGSGGIASTCTRRPA